MKMKLLGCSLLIAVVPLLSSCVNDAASMQIDGKEHSISLVREQKWVWDRRVELSVVVSRMPHCQRRHHLKNSAINASGVEVYSPDFVLFYLKLGERIYLVETNTCEGFRELTSIPPSGLGPMLGEFADVRGRYFFEPNRDSRKQNEVTEKSGGR